MGRRRLAGVVAGAVTVGGVLALGATWGRSAAGTSPPAGAAGPSLRILASNPLLVRMGERVALPVDVVCATGNGVPCEATVTLELREGSGDPIERTVPATPGLVFDVTAPAARAVAGAPSGSVEFSLHATDGTGHSTSLLDKGTLGLFIVRDLPTIDVPMVPFGAVRTGAAVLSLPWGTGPMRAGLAPGNESLTRGPSSFDVAGTGAIHLADPVQGRVAVFRNGVLARETHLGITPHAGVAATGREATYILDRDAERATVRQLGVDGRVGPVVDLGPGIPAELGTVGEAAWANVLPADVFLPVSTGARMDTWPSGPSVARPLGLDGADGLLRVGRERFFRLGYVRDGAVESAVELRGTDRFAELALAEPDGEGGYIVVVRVWRSVPYPADQYQVIHVAGGDVASTFAVSSGSFADIPALSRFRLGPDGDLFHMTTSPNGLRIVRFDLGEDES